MTKKYTEEEIQSNELKRIENEENRIENEENRIENEAERVANEIERIAKEENRIGNEAERVANEIVRNEFYDGFNDRLDVVNSQLEHIVKKNMVSVTDYGAKGDGITDDTQAFLGAISDKRNLIYVPNGTYKINSKLNLSGKSLIGESIMNTKLDFSDNADSECCIYISGFRIELKNIFITANPSVSTQYAIKAHYCTDGAKIENIIINNIAPNGIYIDKSWYVSMSNIRMRRISNDGVGLLVSSTSEGGVNACLFESIYIAGGNNCVKITSNLNMSECLRFVSCTLEGSYRTAIVCDTDMANSIEFDNCYFEHNYAETTDSDVPMICDNTINGTIRISNSMIRQNTINSRYYVKGSIILDNIKNNVYGKVTNDNNQSMYFNSISNLDYTGRNYLSTQTGLKISEYIGHKEATHLFKTKIIKKNISTINEEVAIFQIQRPNDCNVKLNVNIIADCKISYINGFLEYDLYDNSRGSSQYAEMKLNKSVCKYKNNIAECISFNVTQEGYSASLDCMVTTIKMTLNNNEILGDYLFEISGVISTDTELTNKNIVEL